MKKSHLFVLLGILGCLLFTVAFSACRVVDASTIPPAKEVKMGTSDFIDKEVTINKGESVNLVGVAPSPHTINNGQWANGQQDKKVEANAPVVNTVAIPAGGSLTIGPFPVAGDYNYYCTIHPGMNLIVHVK